MQGIAEQGIAEKAKAMSAEGKSHRQIAEALGCAKSTVQKHLAKGNATAPKPQAKVVAEKAATPSGLRGFAMSPASRVALRRPAASIRSRFFELKRGMAYPLADVAKEWGVSADTLRTHARDVECFRYVDMGHDQWTPCVLHPDTAKQHEAR